MKKSYHHQNKTIHTASAGTPDRAGSLVLEAFPGGLFSPYSLALGQVRTIFKVGHWKSCQQRRDRLSATVNRAWEKAQTWQQGEHSTGVVW